MVSFKSLNLYRHGSKRFGTVVGEPEILRKIGEWACVKGCGACCKLGPLDSRPDLATYLTPEDLALYKSMIGSDDWCIHFNKETRMCGQYAARPLFCVVDPARYKVMFDIEKEDFNEFCGFCCREQITDVYGEDSTEMDTFNDVQDQISTIDVE